jgi:hypothetical protein
MDVARYAAEQRTQREEADRGGEHAVRSEPVCHPAADRNENRKAQRLACEHRLHAERCNVERGCDRRHRGIENRGVQRFHEKRHGDQPRHQALAGSGGCIDLRYRSHSLRRDKPIIADPGLDFAEFRRFDDSECLRIGQPCSEHIISLE